MSFLNPVKLNGSRTVRGMLRGFDPFMNVVLENTQEVLPPGQGERYIGMVVRETTEERE